MNFRVLSIVSSLGLMCGVGGAAIAQGPASGSVVDGLVEVQIPLLPNLDPVPPRAYSSRAVTAGQDSPGYRTISLLNVKFSRGIDSPSDSVEVGPELDYSSGVKPFSKSTGAVDLGMNSVPVLDQGRYGTCVTFAATATLDALIGKGDYIDQQCSLELDIADPAHDPVLHDTTGGNYWNGAMTALQVVNPLLFNGVIQKGKCFGAVYANKNARLSSLGQYRAASDKTALSTLQVAYRENFHHFSSEGVLKSLKDSLLSGHRVSFSVLLGAPSAIGYDVTIEGKRKIGGLWACKQKGQRFADACHVGKDYEGVLGGHELVAIGFDDSQRLIKVRNSWGPVAGDSGDFYITYEYFKYWSFDFANGVEVGFGDQVELY